MSMPYQHDQPQDQIKLDDIEVNVKKEEEKKEEKKVQPTYKTVYIKNGVN